MHELFSQLVPFTNAPELFHTLPAMMEAEGFAGLLARSLLSLLTAVFVWSTLADD